MTRFEIIDGAAGYVRVYGWQFDSKRKPDVARVLFTNEHGVTVGAALLGRKIPEIAKAYGPAAARSGFVGYLKLDALGQNLIAVSDACASEAPALITAPSSAYLAISVFHRTQMSS